MKTLKEMITEARQVEYRVSINECRDREGLPISVAILVDKDDQKWFESWLEEEQDNLFGHAEGGNVEY